MNNLHILLDLAAGMLLLGLLLAEAYEVIAVVNIHIPFASNLPLITDIVRPWVMSHKMIALVVSPFSF